MLFVGGIGRMTRRSVREVEGEGPATVIHFDRDIGDAHMVEGGQVFTFASVAGKATVVALGIKRVCGGRPAVPRKTCKRRQVQEVSMV